MTVVVAIGSDMIVAYTVVAVACTRLGFHDHVCGRNSAGRDSVEIGSCRYSEGCRYWPVYVLVLVACNHTRCAWVRLVVVYDRSWRI